MQSCVCARACVCVFVRGLLQQMAFCSEASLWRHLSSFLDAVIMLHIWCWTLSTASVSLSLLPAPSRGSVQSQPGNSPFVAGSHNKVPHTHTPSQCVCVGTWPSHPQTLPSPRHTDTHLQGLSGLLLVLLSPPHTHTHLYHPLPSSLCLLGRGG